MGQKAERKAWTEYFEKQEGYSTSASSSGVDRPRLDTSASSSGADRPKLDTSASSSGADRPRLDASASSSGTDRSRLDASASSSGADRSKLDASASSSGADRPKLDTSASSSGADRPRLDASASSSRRHTPHGVKSIDFMVPAEAIPQGSMKGACSTKADGTPLVIFKSDNPRLHAFRDLVGLFARNARSMAGVHEIFAGPEIPVRASITFVFEKPKSAPKGRFRPSVKPDLDKLTRACMDALTGILYFDDGQVVDDEHHKIYGTPEGVFISVQIVEE